MILEITNTSIVMAVIFVILFFVVYFLLERQAIKNNKRYRKFLKNKKTEM